MSVLTRLSALRIQEAELLATPCAACEHPLSMHRLIPRRQGESRRAYPACRQRRRGDYVCECEGWVEHATERLPL